MKTLLLNIMSSLCAQQQLTHRILLFVCARKINKIFRLDLIFLGLCSPIFIALIYGSSYELWGYFGPYLFAMAAGMLGMIFLVLRLVPQQARKIILWCFLLIVHCYLLFYLYLFFMIWLTGLPPWKIGSSPWM